MNEEDSDNILYRWKAAHSVTSDGNPIKQLVNKSVIRGSIPDEVLSGEICQCGTVIVGGITVTVRIRPVNEKRKKNGNHGQVIKNECVVTCLVCGKETVEEV